jgi:hypothetical protein
MSPAKAMSGTLALTTSVSFQLNEKAMMNPARERGFRVGVRLSYPYDLI